MSKRKLYAVAAVVFKPDPMFQDFLDEAIDTNGSRTIKLRFDRPLEDGYQTDHHYSFLVDAVMASSEDEAKEIAVEKARHKYPESDGWMSHVAGTCLIGSALLEYALRESAETSEDELERVM